MLKINRLFLLGILSGLNSVFACDYEGTVNRLYAAAVRGNQEDIALLEQECDDSSLNFIKIFLKGEQIAGKYTDCYLPEVDDYDRVEAREPLGVILKKFKEPVRIALHATLIGKISHQITKRKNFGSSEIPWLKEELRYLNNPDSYEQKSFK